MTRPTPLDTIKDDQRLRRALDVIRLLDLAPGGTAEFHPTAGDAVLALRDRGRVALGWTGSHWRARLIGAR